MIVKNCNTICIHYFYVYVCVVAPSVSRVLLYCFFSQTFLLTTPHLVFYFPLSVSWCCPPRTQTLSWSTTWMCQLSRIVGSHVGPSCAPSIQTRKNGPNGRRRNSLASWNPCVSVQSHSINWMHNLSLLMHVLSDHCKQCLKKYHYQTVWGWYNLT